MNHPRTKIVTAVIGIIVIIALAVFVLINHKSPVIESPVEVIGSTTPSYKFFPELNFELMPHSGWTEVTSKIDLPVGFYDPIVTFQKQNTQCYLSFAYEVKGTQSKYSQVRFAQRIFNQDNDQFDSSWYIYDPNDSKRGNFDRSSIEAKNPGEIMILYYNPQGRGEGDANYMSFVLFALKDEIVSPDCKKEASAIISSSHRRFDAVSLTATSTGSVFIVPSNYVGVDERPIVAFIENGSQVAKEIMKLDITHYIDKLILYKNKLYYLRTGALHEIDIFAKKEIVVIPAVESSMTTMNGIVDFQIINGVVFYLTGNMWCLDGPNSCDLELHSYDIESKHDELFAKNINAGHILKVDTENQKIYLRRAWGDVGCASVVISIFDLLSKEIIETKSAVGCDGKNSEQFKVVYNIYKPLEIPKFDHLILSNKNLTLSSMPHLYPGEVHSLYQSY